MNPCQRTYKVLVVSLTVLTLFMSSAQAKKPDNPGGSDPGNGGALELLQLAPDAAYSAAWAVNDARLVVGQREGVAGVWDASLAVPTFLPLNGDAAEARDVNADDEIVGWGPNGASYWSSPSAPPIELPISAGLSAYPEAISREGVIVGRAEGSGGDEYAAAWYVDNDIVTGPLVLSADAAAFDVASLGSGVNRVVGASLDPEGKYAATAWDLVVSATGTLTVTNETILLPDFVSRAYAITEGGDVAGSLADANPHDGWPEFPDTAFVLRDGTMRRLSSGRQYSWGAAYDLNDADVVGAIGRGTPEHAAQWDSRNKLGNMTTDYFADSWSNSFAASISAEGSLVGHGVLTEETFSSAWILRRPISATSSAMAIPEPASGTILCLALVGLAIRANRSRRRLPKATDRCADQSISVNSRIASQLAVLTLIVLEASFAPSTEAQSLEWVQQFGTPIADHGRGISLDGLDNLFVTGSSVGSNTSDSEVFLRKHDSDGSLLWTRSQVLSEGNSSYSVAADSAGNAYITGSTWGDLSVNPDDVDAFLTKYAPDGQLIWTQQFGSNLGDESLSVSSDGAGNTYVGGVTWGDLEGPIAGMYDAFVRKYDTNGNLEWGQQFGTDQYDGVEDVFTDALGNLYVGGFTWGSLEGSNAGIADAFVRKYDAAGSTLWTRQFGTPGFDNVWGIHVDVEGNVYLAGSTEGDLGGMNAGQEDAFVRVYDADGDLRWTRQLGYSDTDIARCGDGCIRQCVPWG